MLYFLCADIAVLYHLSVPPLVFFLALFNAFILSTAFLYMDTPEPNSSVLSSVVARNGIRAFSFHANKID
jgi:hypothetical protein